jgi:hypothetical protein
VAVGELTRAGLRVGVPGSPQGRSRPWPARPVEPSAERGRSRRRRGSRSKPLRLDGLRAAMRRSRPQRFDHYLRPDGIRALRSGGPTPNALNGRDSSDVGREGETLVDRRMAVLGGRDRIHRRRPRCECACSRRQRRLGGRTPFERGDELHRLAATPGFIDAGTGYRLRAEGPPNGMDT